MGTKQFRHPAKKNGYHFCQLSRPYIMNKSRGGKVPFGSCCSMSQILSLRRASVLWLRYVVTSASYLAVNRDPGYNESFSPLYKEGNTWMAKGRVEFQSCMKFPKTFLKKQCNAGFSVFYLSFRNTTH